MYQKDYILRMIEMLGDLIRGLLGMLRNGKLDEAEDKLDEAFYTMLRKDASFFANIPADSMTTTLIEDHNYTNNHLLILAELLYVQAELEYTQKKQTDCLVSYRKSLALFEFVDEAYRTWSQDRQDRMKEIRERLGELMNNEE